MDFSLGLHNSINDRFATMSYSFHQARNIVSPIDARFSLPVYQYKKQFLEKLKQNDILLVIGDTGSGKTTQLPQFLYESGYSDHGMIGCTLPRYENI